MNENATSDAHPSLSIVIPVFNEELVISELYGRLKATLATLNTTSEIIFIDDGSHDATFDILKDIHTKDNTVKIIKFSRNFGHHIAITAGLDCCKGSAVILMDGDLQDQPEEIPKLLNKMAEGYNVVYGIRKQKQHGFIKKQISALFMWVMKKLVTDSPHLNSNIFRVLDNKVVENLRSFREHDRVVVGLINYMGFRQTGIEVEHGKRFAGETKYSYKKMIKLGIDYISSFSYAPLVFTTYLGFIISGISFLFILWLFYRKLILNMGITGWTSLMVSVFFIGGIQLICLGIIGEYLARVFTETRKRPLYIIDVFID